MCLRWMRAWEAQNPDALIYHWTRAATELLTAEFQGEVRMQSSRYGQLLLGKGEDSPTIATPLGQGHPVYTIEILNTTTGD